MRNPEIIWALIGLGLFVSIMIGRDNIFYIISRIPYYLSGCALP